MASTSTATAFVGTPLKQKCPPASRGSHQVTQAKAEWYGADRPLWLGPFSTSKNAVPAYLKGEFPGDYGWDTARLSADPETFKRYREIEVMHCRWAMMGTVGCLFPEVMAKAFNTNLGEPLWWKAGAQVYGDSGLSYFGFLHITGPAMAGVVAVQVLMMGLAESYRNDGGPLGQNLDKVYPGEAFDPLGLADDPKTLEELKVKEIKNGRLAMFSMFGYFVQALVTGEGPVDNWVNHVQNPETVNVLSGNLLGRFVLGG